MQDSWEAAGTQKFFSLASCCRDAGLNVGLMYAASEKSAKPELAAGVASNLQSQLVALWCDKVMRIKSADRFRTLVGLFLGTKKV